MKTENSQKNVENHKKESLRSDDNSSMSAKSEHVQEDTTQDMALPEGLGFSMAMNMEAMENFANMSKDEKRRLITQSKLAKSKEEMSQLVDRIATNSWQG